MTSTYHYLMGTKSKQYKMDDFWLTFIILFLFGFIYGFFFSPLEGEQVEFGQTWASKIEYLSINTWYPGRMKEITLQAIIPGFLLKLGISEWTLVLWSSGINMAISFTAVGLLSYLLIRMPVVSIIIPLILINYTFYNAHYYIIVFPMHFSVFGNSGMFFALFSLMLFIFKKRKTSFFFIGFLPGLHIPWGLYVWIVVLFISIIAKESIFKKENIISFLSGFILSITLVISAFLILYPDAGPIENPYKEKLLAYEAKYKSEKKLEKPSVKSKNQKTVKKKGDHKKRLNDMHTPLLRQSGNLFIKSFLFYSYDILLLVFLMAIYLLRRDFITDEFKRLLQGLFIITLLVTIYKVIDEIFLGYDFLTPLSSELPNLINRFIFNRWLNINSVVVVVLMISISAYLAIHFKNLLSFALFIFILVYTLLVGYNIVPHYKLPGYSIEVIIAFFILFHFVVSFGILYLLYSKKQNNDQKLFNGVGKKHINMSFIVILIFFSLSIINMSIQRYSRGEDTNSQLFETARLKKGALILPHFVQSHKGYNIQLRTVRPIYIYGGFNYVIDHPSGRKIDLFCSKKISNIEFSDSLQWPSQFDQVIQECFENIDIEDWKYVGYKLNATQVLTKKHYHLKLPVKVKSEDFILYDIPLD